jgi:hypothetical protein
MKEVSAWFPAPRWKQYAATSGYIYEYIFEGPSGTQEYNFIATSGPVHQRRVRVALEASALAHWSERQRPLTEIECYGIAKMTLLRALDEAATPQAIPEVISPPYKLICEICAELDL